MQDTIGDFVRSLRARRRITQAAAATQAGVSRRTLARWEADRAQPRLPELEAVLEALHASAAQRRQALSLVDAPRAILRIRQGEQAASSTVVLEALPAGGDLLRAMRLRQDRTQGEAARAAGVQTSTLSRWERSEAWPSEPHLHALCFFLGAREEELTALSMGRFRLAQLNETLTEQETLQRLRAWLDAPDTPEKIALDDLTGLTLMAQVWPLAAHHYWARVHLAILYAVCADRLFMQRRFAECAPLAHRALDLAEPVQWAAWQAAVRLASVSALTGTRHGVQRAAEILRLWLPYTNSTFAAWMLADLGKFESLQGRSVEALALGREALCVAAAGDYPFDLSFRQQDLAGLLLHAGRPQEARDLLATLDDFPSFSLMRARVFLALGDESAAFDHLQHTRAWLDANAQTNALFIPHYRAEADALAERLHWGIGQQA